MSIDGVVVAPHPDDAETQMGGTLAKLAAAGSRFLLVDLTDGEPADFAAPGVRREQAAEAARVLGVERLSLGLQDRFLVDSLEVRIAVAAIIRHHRPRWVFGIGEACVHPDHAAAVGLTRAATFLARLQNWDRVPGGESLAKHEPWSVDRLFFPHCKMEPPWSTFAFAVDVTEHYEKKRHALGAYASVFKPEGDRLLDLYEAEDQFYGRLCGVGRAEIFRSASPLLVEDLGAFRPGIQA